MHHRPLIALAALVALLLVGCGSTNTPSASTAARTTTDARGTTVTVPARAQRVVALSEPTLDAALALGVRPIATTNGRGQAGVPEYLADRAQGIESVGLLGQPNLERIAALRPDLILIDGTATADDGLVAKLRAIAPTVYVSRNAADWRTAFMTEARLLGREGEGRARLAAFDRRVAEIRDRLDADGNAGASVSVIRWSGVGLPSTIKQELPVSAVLKELGFTRPPSQSTRGPGHSVPISLENLDLFDADWLFFASLGGSVNSPAAGTKDSTGVAASRRALQVADDTPGFARLQVVRDGHVVPVDGSAWTSAGGLLAEEVVLDDVERTLAPAT